MKIFSEEIHDKIVLAVFVTAGVLNAILVAAFFEWLGFPVMEMIVDPVLNVIINAINKTL